MSPFTIVPHLLHGMEWDSMGSAPKGPSKGELAAFGRKEDLSLGQAGLACEAALPGMSADEAMRAIDGFPDVMRCTSRGGLALCPSGLKLGRPS